MDFVSAGTVYVSIHLYVHIFAHFLPSADTAAIWWMLFSCGNFSSSVKCGQTWTTTCTQQASANGDDGNWRDVFVAHTGAGSAVKG